MKFVNKEFTIELLKQNIISHRVNADCSGFTLDGAMEAIQKMDELVADKHPTKMITYPAAIYVKKDIMKYFATSFPKSITSIALVCPGYISKYVASIGIKMYHRFYQDENDLTEIKIFMEEDKAIEWLTSV